MIEIGTVSTRTDPSDYWDEGQYETVEFVDSIVETERTAYLTELTIQAAVGEADADSFIVETQAETMYDHPDYDIKVKVYDGYNE